MAAARRGYRVRVVPPYYKAKVQDDCKTNPSIQIATLTRLLRRGAGRRATEGAQLGGVLTILVRGY
jgi:hypothetical protein